MTLNQVRKLALALPETQETPHFHRTSFRVRGKIFVTADPKEAYVHVFVGEDDREPAIATHGDWIEKLMWGGKAVGLRIALGAAERAVVADLIRQAWRCKAPRTLVQQVDQAGQ